MATLTGLVSFPRGARMTDSKNPSGNDQPHNEILRRHAILFHHETICGTSHRRGEKQPQAGQPRRVAKQPTRIRQEKLVFQSLDSQSQLPFKRLEQIQNKFIVEPVGNVVNVREV